MVAMSYVLGPAPKGRRTTMTYKTILVCLGLFGAVGMTIFMALLPTGSYHSAHSATRDCTNELHHTK